MTEGARTAVAVAKIPSAAPRTAAHRDPSSARPMVSAGNQQLLRALGVRAKLEVSQPTDPDEQEADRLADAFVARRAVPTPCPACSSSRAALMRKGDAAVQPGSAASALPSGPGEGLAPEIRSEYEGFFDADLSAVRVHTGERARSTARALGAQAFAIGSDVYFGAGRFAPQSGEGRRLLAHELAHTLQRRGPATVRRTPETWYRGEAAGVGPAAPGSVVHDFGDGLYLTNDPAVAGEYAILRAGTEPSTGSVASATFERSLLGRVLDLTHDARWAEFMRTSSPSGVTYEQLIRMANENYWSFFQEFLRRNGLALENFDAIIGPEYVRGGSQVCIRTASIADQVRGLLHPAVPGAVPGEPPPPAEFRVGTNFRVLSTESMPGGGTVSQVEVVLGEGLEELNRAAAANGGRPVPPTFILRITTDPAGALVAADTATAEAAGLAETLARQAIANAPRAAAGAEATAAGAAGGVSPWVRGASWAGIALFLAVTTVRLATAPPSERPRVAAQSAGGLAGGFVSSYIVCNLALGLETAGWSLLICGFLAGIPGAIAGEALANVAYEEATIDDDAIRAWVAGHDLGTIGGLPMVQKVRLIFSLMKGWISDDDVSAMERICQSVTTRAELDAMSALIEPQITEMTSIGQRTRLRFALARRI